MKVREILEAVKPVWKPNKNYSSVVPMVTVILPTFRRAKSGHFERAVESVLNQSYSSWELIIVDDASVDGTEDLIRFYMDNDSRINTIRHTNNMGLPSVSEYEGYIRARGQYIAFIFDDNIWEKDHLMTAVKTMVKDNVKFNYGMSRLYIDEKNTLLLGNNMNHLSVTNFIGNGAVVLHRDVIEKVGLYDPHLSLARLCDWDLWRRISKDYILKGLETVSTSEKGTTLKDSLGNTVDMNSWIAAERMSYDRRRDLLPENYPEADILEVKDDDTDFYCEYLKNLYKQYQKKVWYTQDVSFINGKKPKKRVLIVGFIDATYYLSFDNIKDSAIFKITGFAPDYAVINDAIMADAIIFIRNTPLAIKLSEKIKSSMKKPPEMFLYLDDNFIELAKDKTLSRKVAKECEELANCLNRASCKRYSGIIVPSIDLRDYFIEKNIHDNVIYIPPVTVEQDIHSITDVGDTVNIAFMGGSFREQTFVDIVYPAIKRLSEEKKVRIICTNTLAEAIKDNYNDSDNIELVSFEWNNCYPQFIRNVAAKNVNILIHTGAKMKNNRFKTKNALMNAVKLGAVLIASDVPPYTDTDAIITVKPKTDDWYDAIRKYAFEKNARLKQYERQCSYIRAEHSKQKAEDLFTSILDKVTPCSETDMMNRYDLLLSLERERIRVLESSMPVVPAPVVDTSVNAVWNPDKIVFSGQITNKKRYFIRSTAAQINKLGVIFTSLDNKRPSGTISCTISDKKNNVLTTSSCDMSAIIYNNWTYFRFTNLELPSEYYLTFEFSYNAGSALLGIYENISRRTLFYRIAKKFRLSYCGVNVPLIDLSHLN